jgi:tetratricopeptide (TPR) repeat protein
MSTHIENIGNIGTANFNFANDKPSLPSNIPSPKGFIGREVELAALRQAKTDGKTSFVLHGIGGVGKTDLALKFIDEIKADYSAHVRVDMRGLSDKPTTANDAKLEVIRMFKPDVPANLEYKDINNLYISLLNQHKTILFFDNAKDREQVESLNNASAFVVITSRATFNVSSGFSLPVEQMSPADARNLLYSVADETRFDGQADALAYLAGYLPMALLPLGSLLAEYETIEAVELVAKYKDRKERLQLADPNRENLTVMASFDLSYERLSDELQTCWRKLAVFPADCNLEAMQAVWQIADGKTMSGELVKKHLIEFNKDTKRFHLHDLTRDYTGEKLLDEECFESGLLHSVHFGNMLASLQTVTFLNLDRFDLERSNIEQGFAWLFDKIELNDVFAQLYGYYIGYASEILMLRIHLREYMIWLEIGLKASRKLDEPQQIASHLDNLGIAYSSLGEYQKAIEYYEKALIVCRKIIDTKGESMCLGNLGIAYSSLGKYHEAIECYKQALLISKNIGNSDDNGKHLGNLGIVYRNLGKYHKAIEYHEQSLVSYKEIGDIQGEGNALGSLGNAYRDLGKNYKAMGYYEQALLIFKKIGFRQGEDTCLGNLGIAYSSLGEYQKAIEYLEQSLSVSREVGNLQGEGNHLGNLGGVYHHLNEYQKAKDYYLQAIKILDKIQSPNAELFRQNLASLK